MNLATLPLDIIRQIIGTAQKAIESMRLISPQWNDLALEHLTFRSRLPSIESFRWHVRPSMTSTIVLTIPHVYLDYFGVTRWSRHHFKNRIFTVEVTSPPLRPMIGLFWGFSETYDREKALWDRIVKLLRRCSRIKQLFLFPGADKTGSFDMLRMAMDEVVVENLVINDILYFTEQIGSKVLEILRAHAVKSLFISNRQHTIDLEKFFSEAMRLVPIVKMPCTGEHRDHRFHFFHLKSQLRRIPHFKTTINVYPRSAYIEVVAVGDRFRKVGMKPLKQFANLRLE